MNFNRNLLVLVSVFAVFGSFVVGDKPNNWNDLKRTWGINPFGNSFVSMPRTVNDAIKQGWILDKNCSQTHQGNRYTNGDNMTMLLFGNDGEIAGISAGIPKNLTFNWPSGGVKKFFKDEGNLQTITAYFKDPATICSNGQYNRAQQTGDRLIIENSDGNWEIPYMEKDLEGGKWTKGQCFWTMGQHYWADLSGKVNVNTTPDNFVPAFLLYNKGKLNGFGWAMNYDSPSNNVEHPQTSTLGNFFVDIPKQFYDPSQSGTLSTLHIFLDSTPRLNFC
jgi:hypothetical protein